MHIQPATKFFFDNVFLSQDGIMSILYWNRLDQQGIFMNPVDDSNAPDYSKVIKNPMCFLKMREKIDSEQYKSWVSFVVS